MPKSSRDRDQIVDLREITDRVAAKFGAKAANLARMNREGLPVPPGFCVGAEWYRRHVSREPISNSIRLALAEMASTSLNLRHSLLSGIRKEIVTAQLDPTLAASVANHYQQLGRELVAVRSSATAEDLPGHSFAGQYDTFLNVASLESCLDAVKECWASLWTERACDYRQRNGIDHRHVAMAVIVQEQVDADAAGVAFTLDPVTGSPSRIVIEACAGLGNALVSGRVQPDRLVLRKKNAALIHWDAPDGVRRATIDDPSATSEPSLPLRTAKQLVRGVRKIESRLGCPQDIEWAVRDGRVWFLQARAITVVPPQKAWEDRQVWTNSNLGEVMPDVTTPATWSMFKLLLSIFGSVFRLVGADARKNPIAGLVAGRVYFNVNTVLAIARPFGTAGSEMIDEAGTILGGDDDRMYALGEIDIPDEDLPDLGFRWPKYILSLPRVLYDLLLHSPRRGRKARARVRARSDALRALDTFAMSNAEIADTAFSSLRSMVRDVDLLYLINGAAGMPVLERAYEKWLGEMDLTIMYRLFAAQGGMADAEAGLAMWSVAELAHANDQTREQLLAGDAWDVLRDRLARTEHGREFVAAWDHFMDEHGHNCRGQIELFNPRWSETPDYVLGLVRNYLRSIPQVDVAEHRRRLIAERDELTEQCRRRLSNPVKRFLFTWALQRCRRLVVDRENWKDELVRLLAAVRRLLLVLGERLSGEGVFSERDDIFFLKLTENESIAKGTAEFDVKQTIVTRRAQYDRDCSVAPPPVVIGQFDPEAYVAPSVNETTDILNGIAVSPGVVTGRARVILRTDNNQHVEAGEILVAPFTDPAWTPYFLPAAGVVMDMGGILSHGAIVAREYGIPCVVNVGPATKIIQTGQIIQVDGNRGVVRIVGS
jgi:phosphohistidine swiveling domain-containing protein